MPTAQLTELCGRLEAAATDLDLRGTWPREQLQWCAEAGVFQWFLPREFGGKEWSEEQILDGYLSLSQSCLTTTFVLTQWNAAARRIMGSDNSLIRSQLLPKLASGDLFATVGISHLTTSRQHLAEPVLRATMLDDGGFVLDGFSPWVTGGAEADVLVVGATLPTQTQVLVAVPRTRDGSQSQPGSQLVALTASCTDRVDFQGVRVASSEVLAGPVEQVMQSRTGGGGAGGLQTSTLAVGLSLRAARFLREQASQRPELNEVADKVSADAADLRQVLFSLTRGDPPSSDDSSAAIMTASGLRQKANSLALRSTQAALQAAKGAGFVATHPAGRWAREAMFFLVWSCPQAVSQANLCELAQLG